MITGCMIFYIGNTIQITSMTAWYQLAIGRFICGLAVGSLSGKLLVTLARCLWTSVADPCLQF